MSTLDQIIRIIATAKQNKVRLNLDDTLAVFEAVKHISTDKKLIEKAIHMVFQVQQKKTHIQSLTKRENEIFQLIGLGFSSREIGRFISISEATVSTHRKKIIQKLNLSGAGALQKTAYQFAQSQLSK